MLDLDERFATATRDLHDRLLTVELHPAAAVIRRYRRRRRSAVACAAALAVVGVSGLAMVVTRDTTPTSPADISVPVPRNARDRLLYPSVMVGGQPDQVMLGPEASSGSRGLVRAPSGALFRIGISERFGEELTTGTERREINGRTVAVERVDGDLFYVSLDDCAVVHVLQSADGAIPWDPDASAILASLVVDARRAVVTLPTGWTSFGAGGQGTLIQVAFHAVVDGASRQINLMQLPDSPIAPILGQVGSRLRATTFNGHDAWTGTNDIFTTLAWEDGANAVVLYSDTATLEGLKQIATTLEHDHSADLDATISSADVAPTGTSPVPDTTPEGDTTNATDCGSAQLTIDQPQASATTPGVPPPAAG